MLNCRSGAKMEKKKMEATSLTISVHLFSVPLILIRVEVSKMTGIEILLLPYS